MSQRTTPWLENELYLTYISPTTPTTGTCLVVSEILIYTLCTLFDRVIKLCCKGTQNT